MITRHSINIKRVTLSEIRKNNKIHFHHIISIFLLILIKTNLLIHILKKSYKPHVRDPMEARRFLIRDK